MNTSSKEKGNEVIEIHSSDDEESPSKKQKLTFGDYWSRVFECSKRNDDWKSTIPESLEAYYDLCQDPAKLKEAQIKFWKCMLPTEAFSPSMSETFFHLFFMLEKHPAVLVEQTHEHVHVKELYHFWELLQYFATAKTDGTSKFVQEFQPFCQQFSPFDWLHDVTYNRRSSSIQKMTIFGLLEERDWELRNSISPIGWEPIKDTMVRERLETYDEAIMERIQQSGAMGSNYLPWHHKRKILWQSWAHFFKTLSPSQTQVSDAIPTTVLEMERIRRDPLQYRSTVNKLYKAMVKENIWRGSNNVLNTQQTASMLEFAFVWKHHKMEAFKNTNKYIPLSVMRDHPMLLSQMASTCLKPFQGKTADMLNCVTRHMESRTLYPSQQIFPFLYTTLFDYYVNELPNVCMKPDEANEAAAAMKELEAAVLKCTKEYKQEKISAFVQLELEGAYHTKDK